jgi:hypothetical protein
MPPRADLGLRPGDDWDVVKRDPFDKTVIAR